MGYFQYAYFQASEINKSFGRLLKFDYELLLTMDSGVQKHVLDVLDVLDD